MTIYALSTVYGKSGVAVIRISGNNALDVVKYMTNLDSSDIQPRHAYFIRLLTSDFRFLIDKSLLIYFPAPNSFTGEDVIELHIHGSKAVIKSVLDNLAQIEGFRLAEAGEFSKRAFHNGKMDLTEAEGLADLIDSETAEQQKYALRQMEGSLKNLYDGWREDIIKILAHLEAYIDFPDEEIPESIKNNILNSVFKLKDEIFKHRSQSDIGERLREGFRVVIVGPPNAGKSSLLNAIAKRDVAIVSEIKGTTRDAIDIHLDIKGYPVTFTDTAGIRQVEDEIEKQGIKIALEKINQADLILCLFDATKDTVQAFDSIKNTFQNKELYVANKSDLLTSPLAGEARVAQAPLGLATLVRGKPVKGNDSTPITISAKQNQGIDTLLDAIYTQINDKFTSNSGLLITRSRYKEALKETEENLDNFNLDKEIELAAEDIRLAARALGKITGRIEITDILNKIFSDFCIGK